jgi:hypothetical protein
VKLIKRAGIAGIALLGLILAIWLVSLLPGSLNPFTTENVDRSQPAVLKSIEDIGEYRAATANLQLVVDLEKDTRFVPSFIKGERTLFVAAGTVDGGVDFRKLGQNGVVVDDDRKRVTITLPAAQLFEPKVDLRRSSVVDRERGVIDRIGSLIGDGEDEREVLLLAEQKLRQAAREDPQLLARSEENTRKMLETLLGSLGFESVTVTFAPEPGN